MMVIRFVFVYIVEFPSLLKTGTARNIQNLFRYYTLRFEGSRIRIIPIKYIFDKFPINQ